jgi:hypothetical protein
MTRPTARICAYCKKQKGVTFYAVEIDGRMRSVAAHPTCINKLRKKLKKR